MTTEESPFNLIHETDVMLLVEIGEPSLRRKFQEWKLSEESFKIELDLLDEL